MAHARKQIRDAAVAQLTGLVTTGANVFPGQVYDVDPAFLPCLLIYTRHERVGYESEQHPRDQRRKLTLEIRGRAPVTSLLEDTLDQIATEVEIAMDKSVDLGGLVSDLVLTDTSLSVDLISVPPHGDATLTYEVTYSTMESEAPAPVNSFITFHADSQLDADAEAELVTEETLPL